MSNLHFLVERSFLPETYHKYSFKECRQDTCLKRFGDFQYISREKGSASLPIKTTLLNCIPSRTQEICEVCYWHCPHLNINSHSCTTSPLWVMQCNSHNAAVLFLLPQLGLGLALSMCTWCHRECAPSRVIWHHLEKHCVNNQSSRAKDINGANYKSEQIYSFC